MEVRQTYNTGRFETPGSGEEVAGAKNRLPLRSQSAEAAQSPEHHHPAYARVTGSAAAAAASGVQAHPALTAFVAVDRSSRNLLDQIRRVAQSASAVLLRGEAGVGKDLAASLIHYLGPHADEPLIRLDCANLPQEMLVRELFGSPRNGDASHVSSGRLETVGRGTVVLDEVAALSMPLQAKLLRVMEQGEFDRGSEPPVRVRARIIALTHVNLERAVARRSFREDLYYRLNVTSIAVPPLRERQADILPLAEHFLGQLSQVHRRPQPSLAQDAVQTLLAFHYPGNVRQLRNIIEHVVVSNVAPEIREADLPAYMRVAGGHPLVTIEELERDYIANVLQATQGRKSRAAQILGISRKTLLEKRKRYGLE